MIGGTSSDDLTLGLMGDSADGLEREVNVPRPLRWVLGILVLAAAVLFGLLAWALLRADSSTFVSSLGAQVLIWLSLLFAVGFGFIALRLFAIRTPSQHLFSARAAMVIGIGSIVVGVLLLFIGAYTRLVDVASPALFPIAMGIYLYAYGKKRRAAGAKT